MRELISLSLGVLAVTMLGLASVRAAAPEVRVMTLNLRYATAPDGDNAWDKRKEFLAEVIQQFHPDLLGTQEVLAVQADFVAEHFKGLTLVGVGRDDGKRAGEFSAIFFNVLAMGLNPSPSGETFRFFVLLEFWDGEVSNEFAQS